MTDEERNEERLREEKLEEEMRKEQSKFSDEDPKFIHRDQPPKTVHEQLPPDEEAERKRRKRWIRIGIILLLVIGIPLILFGTCILLIARANG